MPRDTSKLQIKEELFISAFLAHGNASAAAKSAGYSEKTAHAKGCELLKRPRVAAAIQAAKTRIVKKHNVTAERVVEEMALIGFSDIGHYELSEDGQLTLAAGAPENARRAVKKFKRKLRIIPQKDGHPSITEIESEIELWSKDSQLHNLGDYLKLFKENRVDAKADDDDDLTPAQRNERIIGLLKVAIMRKKQAKRAS